jgi:hypothetical protein
MAPPDPTLIPSDMNAALDNFRRDAQQIVDSFQRTLDEAPTPPILYHYTNDVGLKGMLESGRLWLTDITSVNDPSELTYAFSRALPILHDLVANTHAAGKHFTDHIAAFAHTGGVHMAAHYFLCAFSSQGDDLGQWRAYADNGKGYVLAFDGRLLERAFTHEDGIPHPQHSTFHVAYDDTRLREVQTQIVKCMTHLVVLPQGRNLDGPTINAYMAELTVSTLLYLMQVVLFFKHGAYSNESEFRFLEIHRMDRPPDVKLRARSYSMVKYREFDWKSAAPEALLEICIGPAADLPKANKFAQDCLNLAPGLNPRITHSIIPYRALS